MPHLSKKRYTKNGLWYRVIRDGFRTYPTIDHWIDDIDRRQKWNKKRHKFAADFFRR